MTAHAHSEAIEYLSTGSHPDMGVGQPFPLSLHVEICDAATEAGLETHGDKEGCHDQVGEQSDEVRQLAVRLNPLDQGQRYDQPGER